MDNKLTYSVGLRDIPKDVEKTRTLSYVISTDAKDRHGTVLNMTNWNLKNFNANPIVGYQHDVYGSFLGEANPDLVLGTAKAYMEEVKRGDKTGVQLVADITYEPKDINPLAEKIFRKSLAGTLKATSSSIC